MPGSWVLVILIIVSSIPVIAVYIWFKTAKYQISLVQFLFALLAGAAAFFPALIIQQLLLFPFITHGRMALFYEFFIRIALSEELSRLLMLFIFFWISSRVKPGDNSNQLLTFGIVRRGTAIGLVAGLGFAILESATYAASDMTIRIVLLRFFTAALHGACGSRIGAAALLFRTNPVQALLRIFTATAIHGIYNFMVTMPGLSSIAAILIAVSALFTAVLTIHTPGPHTPGTVDKSDEKT